MLAVSTTTDPTTPSDPTGRNAVPNQAPHAIQNAGRTAGRFVRGHWRLLVVSAVTGALLAVAVIVVRWWTHPDVFGPDIDNGLAATGSRALERSQVTIGVTYPAPVEHSAVLTFRSVPVAEFGKNTAHATVTFSLCEGTFTGAIGSAYGTGRRYCARLVPIVAGTQYPYPSTDEYIVATVTPRTTGRVVLTGADFNYSMDRAHWWRRGVDHIDMHIVIGRVR